MRFDEYRRLSATELNDLFVRREVSPVEVARLALEAIAATNPTLGAFITVTEGIALEQARAAETAILAGEAKGPLLGVPVSIKDLEPMAGVRFTRGSLASDEIAPEDGLCVERLRNAGAVILGKTNTAEFGFGTTSENRICGITRNPWNPRLTSSGS